MSVYKSLLLTPGQRQQGAWRGLLNVGQALSAAGAPSTMPTSTMGAFSKGLAAYAPGYDQYANDMRGQKLQNTQYQMQQQQMQQQQMAIDAAKRKKAQEDQQRLAAERYATQQQMGGAQGPTIAAGQAQNRMDPLTLATMQADPVGYMQSAYSTQTARTAADLAHQRALELKGADVPAAYQSYKLAQSGGFPGTFVDYQKMLKQAGASTTTIDMAGAKKEDEEFAKGLVARENAVYDAGNTASGTLQNLSMAKAIVGASSVDPTAFGTTLGTVATGFGIPLPDGFAKNVTSGQAFEAQMGNILAAKLAAQKGPQTDRDANRMEKTMATLSNTPQARIFALDAAAAIAERDIQKADFFRAWRAEKGTAAGAETAWQKDIGGMPLFGTDPSSNLPVFYEQFMKAARLANRNMTDQQIKAKWKELYAR
jgi:hypothetical protein